MQNVEFDDYMKNRNTRSILNNIKSMTKTNANKTEIVLAMLQTINLVCFAIPLRNFNCYATQTLGNLIKKNAAQNSSKKV